MEETIYKEEELDLMVFFAALKENAIRIIAVAMLFAIIGYAVTEYGMTKRYEASVNMIVNTRKDMDATVTNDNINSAKNLVDTYAIVLKSNIVLSQVIDELDLDCTTKELADMIDISAVNATQIMKVSAKNKEPELALAIVEEIAKVGPEALVEAVEAGSCKVVSNAEVSENPVEPSVKKNTVTAFALGMILACAVIVIKTLFNNKIVDDQDIQKYLGIPVLGVIPEIKEK